MILLGNPIFRAMKRIALPALLALALVGCVTTPADRIARNQAAFASWTPEVQAIVRQGKIAIGFDQQQVSVALGNPDRSLTRTTAAGVEEVWIYRSHRPRITVGIGMVGGGGSTRVGGATEVTSGGNSGDTMHVVFTGGRVSAVEERSY